MKHDMQEPFRNLFLTRRASLLALMTAPGAVGGVLAGRAALASDHEQLVVLQELRPETWVDLYRQPIDISSFQEAYRNPSRENTIAAARAMNLRGDRLIGDSEENILIDVINSLFDSDRESMMEIRAGIGEIVNDFHEGVNTVTDAVGVIVLGALDFARDIYDEFDLDMDRVRSWIARQVISAIARLSQFARDLA